MTCRNSRGSPRRATPGSKPRVRREPDMAAARMDYEPAGELKIGQVGIANLRVRTLDAQRLADEMRDRVARAPKLFERAAVVIDFGGLANTPDRAPAQRSEEHTSELQSL